MRFIWAAPSGQPGFFPSVVVVWRPEGLSCNVKRELLALVLEKIPNSELLSWLDEDGYEKAAPLSKGPPRETARAGGASANSWTVTTTPLGAPPGVGVSARRSGGRGEEGRNMSFALTTEQVRRPQTVTRQLRWSFLRVGDIVRPVRKARGLRRVSASRDWAAHSRRGDLPRTLIGKKQTLRGARSCRGFQRWSRNFVGMFCEHNGCVPSTVNRIKFEYVPPETA
jgi:hypothetical protein